MSVTRFSSFLWDLWCAFSGVGIWPRWIEPNILTVKKLNISIANLPPALNHLNIVQFSDLHLHAATSNYFLNKLVQKVEGLKPDILVFTGDFLCHSKADKRLASFLNRFSAPYGCFAVLGNHDYAETVSVNEKGEYDVLKKELLPLHRGFGRLFLATELKKRPTKQALNVQPHQELIDLLKKTPFQLLENSTKTVQIKTAKLNVTGLGEYTMGKSCPEIAFKEFDKNFPGLVLLHNPDGFSLLKEYPGELVLSGHTHGGQINLPWFSTRFTLLENPDLKKGLFAIDDKWLFVSRGVGSVLPFRLFSFPQIVSYTLVNR